MKIEIAYGNIVKHPIVVAAIYALHGMVRAAIDLGPQPSDLPEWLAHATAKTMREGPFPYEKYLTAHLKLPPFRGHFPTERKSPICLSR